MAKIPPLQPYAPVLEPFHKNADLTPEQRKISVVLARKLLSAAQIELPYAYEERNGKRYYTLCAKRGAVEVALVVTTEIPK